MIMIRFSSCAPTKDVTELLENNLTDHKYIEDWLVEKVPSIGFDSMDFPYDTEDCYDCCFESKSEEADTESICRTLQESAVEFSGGIVEISVGVVDDKHNFIKEIWHERIGEVKNADRL